jgi:hypothetical protein
LQGPAAISRVVTYQDQGSGDRYQAWLWRDKRKGSEIIDNRDCFQLGLCGRLKYKPLFSPVCCLSSDIDLTTFFPTPKSSTTTTFPR